MYNATFPTYIDKCTHIKTRMWRTIATVLRKVKERTLRWSRLYLYSATGPVISRYVWCALPTTFPFPSHAILVLVLSLRFGPYIIRLVLGPCWVSIRRPNPVIWPIIRVLPLIWLAQGSSLLCPWLAWPYPAIRCGCRGHLLPSFHVPVLEFLVPGLLVLPLFF